MALTTKKYVAVWLNKQQKSYNSYSSTTKPISLEEEKKRICFITPGTSRRLLEPRTLK